MKESPDRLWHIMMQIGILRCSLYRWWVLKGTTFQTDNMLPFLGCLFSKFLITRWCNFCAPSLKWCANSCCLATDNELTAVMQFIASAPTLFPVGYVNEFQNSFHQAPVVPYNVIESIMRDKLQQPLHHRGWWIYWSSANSLCLHSTSLSCNPFICVMHYAVRHCDSSLSSSLILPLKILGCWS